VKKLLSPEFAIYLFLGFIIYEISYELYNAYTYLPEILYSQQTLLQMITTTIPIHLVIFYIIIIEMLENNRWYLGFIVLAYYLYYFYLKIVHSGISLSAIWEGNIQGFVMEYCHGIAAILISFAMYTLWKKA